MFANTCRTTFFLDVRFIFIAEIAQGGQNGVRGGLSESAQRVFFDVVAESLEPVEVLRLSVAGGDFFKNFEHTAVADTAGRALSAAFVDGELEELLDGADIAGIRVHSVRLPGYSVSTEIVFGGAGERLSLRHDAGASAEPYVAGTLLAVRRVGDEPGVRRGLGRLLFDD